MANPIAPAATQGLGPRALAFFTKATQAKNEITAIALLKIVRDLDQNRSAKDFVATNITPAVQEEIANLETRVQVLFKNVVLDVFIGLAHTNNQFGTLTSLLKLSTSAGDPRAHVKYIEECSLPIIKKLVADLDENFPGVIDEAIADGVASPELRLAFQLDV